jgi:hypothetical protein
MVWHERGRKKETHISLIFACGYRPDVLTLLNGMIMKEGVHGV